MNCEQGKAQGQGILICSWKKIEDDLTKVSQCVEAYNVTV